MQVKKTRFEDIGPEDEEGFFEYCYFGFIYQFASDTRRFSIRQYDEAPDEAAFLRCSEKKGKWRFFESVPYDDESFRQNCSGRLPNPPGMGRTAQPGAVPADWL